MQWGEDEISMHGQQINYRAFDFCEGFIKGFVLPSGTQPVSQIMVNHLILSVLFPFQVCLVPPSPLSPANCLTVHL